MQWQCNITDTALILEGGGMRASYTSGLATVLLEAGMYFDYVSGVSAGASILVNYTTRDVWRMRASFVDVAGDRDFGGMRHWLRGEGYFNARYIYERTGYAEGSLPFDLEAFRGNPVEVSIGAFDALQGDMRYWHKEDLTTLRDIMRIVRASSSLPIVMPPTYVGGVCYWDGGLGESIPLAAAQAAGYERFFVIRTQERAYRKEEKPLHPLVRRLYHKQPKVIEAMAGRAATYNREVEGLYALEAAGKAFVVCPDDMPVGRSETDVTKLAESFEAGKRQGYRDLPKWLDFLAPGQQPETHLQELV